MNFLLHFLIGYLAVDSVFGNAFQYIMQIFVFSNILDLDHIPYLLKVRQDVLRKKFGSASRSRFHEMYGLALLSFLVALFSLFDMKLAGIIALSLILHQAADFLVGKSRPFYPFSKKEVFLGILPEKRRIIFEAALTSLLGAVFLWNLLG